MFPLQFLLDKEPAISCNIILPDVPAAAGGFRSSEGGGTFGNSTADTPEVWWGTENLRLNISDT